MSLEDQGIEIVPVENLSAKLAGTVFVKTLSGEEFDAWQEAASALPEKGSTMKRFAGFAAACACREDGTPRFTAEQAIKLSVPTLKAIFAQGMDLNGLSARSQAEAKKA